MSVSGIYSVLFIDTQTDVEYEENKRKQKVTCLLLPQQPPTEPRAKRQTPTGEKGGEGKGGGKGGTFLQRRATGPFGESSSRGEVVFDENFLRAATEKRIDESFITSGKKRSGIPACRCQHAMDCLCLWKQQQQLQRKQLEQLPPSTHPPPIEPPYFFVSRCASLTASVSMPN